MAEGNTNERKNHFPGEGATMKHRPVAGKVRCSLLCSALVLALSTATAAMPAHAQDAPEKKHFEVPSQPAASALNQFAEQADITLVFSQDAVSGVVVRPLKGSYSKQDALRVMRESTGLAWHEMEGGVISVTRSTGAGHGSAGGTQDLQTITVTGTRIRGGTTPSPIISIGSERIQEE